MDDVAANYAEKGRCGATYVGSRSSGTLEVSMLAALQATAQKAIILPYLSARRLGRLLQIQPAYCTRQCMSCSQDRSQG